MIDIVIITYNRSEKLLRTLRAIVEHLVPSVSLYVLDNCSTDATESICRSFEGKIHYQKNPYNIGFAANILRAWEVGASPYLWVLCDDDQLFFNQIKIQQLLDSLRQYQPDLIHVLNHSSRHSIQAGQFYPQLTDDLLTPEFFGAISFPPGMIIRRSLLTSRDFFLGYYNAHNLYNYMVLWNRLLMLPLSLYVSPELFVRRSPDFEISFPPFDAFMGWLIVCSSMPRSYHARVLYAIVDYGHLYFSGASLILRQRLDWKKPSLYFHLRALWEGSSQARVFLLLILPFSLVPRFVLCGFRQLFQWYKYKVKKHDPAVDKRHYRIDDLFRS
jgi:glycosyltransferase involved in cell wall biosynthesis